MILQIENTDIRIFGTIHVLREGINRRQELIEELVDCSSECVFEHEFKQPDLSLMFQRTKEDQWINENERCKYEEIASGVGLELKCLDELKHWGFMLLYPVKRIEKEGYFHNIGIDSIAHGLASERHKTISYLEDSSSVFEAFDSAPKIEHLNQIQQFIEDPDQPIKNIKRIISAWTEKNLGDFERILEDLRLLAPLSVEANVEHRNKLWIPRIVESLEQNKKAVFFVGTMHLVGEIGLKTLLESKGYKTKII